MPGLSLGIFGHWFNRHETWAEQAGPWMTYLARSSYMMQQGKPVEDILYFYGEDTNLTTLFKFGQPEMPAGYSYDFVNADALEIHLYLKHAILQCQESTEGIGHDGTSDIKYCSFALKLSQNTSIK